ncbi:peptidoglycan bridge formation glycyltransferase FemA/FemB family protein [Nesterenkonia sp. NBAIMH1]|uniref:lipid II:glycine glycyltransferase FemX n=1 Tax=Nesterenkonia sp. NBAIMH1 TaxID=2600320 RepID=UPI001FEE5D18|nr:peptidoglycan bridge formation glycyltransferase FemA/FemB family protein [Nesterenkonia sp. NBAIMH1]
MRTAPQPSGRAITLRPISSEEHLRFLAAHPAASFMQNPQWALVKKEWDGFSLGLFRHGDDGAEALAGTALVLGRRLPVPRRTPVLGRRRLAYIPEGPILDEARISWHEALPALTEHLSQAGAFLVRMGLPGHLRRWGAEEVRHALASAEKEQDAPQDVSALPPAWEGPHMLRTRQQLLDLGWREPEPSTDFEAGQPQFAASIPLTTRTEDGAEEALTSDEVLGRMSSTSKRQTRKSARSELTVLDSADGDVSERLSEFQRLYEATASSQGFIPRPAEYFRRMHDAMNRGGLSECRVLCAHFEGQPLAAAVYLRQGDFGFYAYGASSHEERKRYAPRLLQLHQVELALAAGCRWYGLGGVSPSLEAGSPARGLLEFKTTMGADVVQSLGEWDYQVSPALAKVFSLYMASRSV